MGTGVWLPGREPSRRTSEIRRPLAELIRLSCKMGMPMAPGPASVVISGSGRWWGARRREALTAKSWMEQDADDPAQAVTGQEGRR